MNILLKQTQTTLPIGLIILPFLETQLLCFLSSQPKFEKHKYYTGTGVRTSQLAETAS